MVEIWPRTPSTETLIAEAWQSTGDMLKDAITEVERGQRKAPSKEVQAGRENKRAIPPPNS